ncbi:MAG: hypothetical protein EHM19_06220 [Candidatus Latescibacterota bacterium]|nr:MAG: hypothetical protein EHM19_06220 [Candidatus Latescibacterota bacterium]
MRKLALAGVFLLGLALPSAAGEVPRKKIDVLEKAFDATMVESSNALVRPGRVARGVYIEAFGVLFKMEFTFVHRPSMKLMDNMDNIDSLKDYWREVIREDDEKGEEGAKRRREQLDRIEDELIETLVDYGSTLGSLGDDERVAIVAFPWEGAWEVSPSPVRSIRITARFGDIRAYAESRIDEAAVRSRVQVVEEVK